MDQDPEVASARENPDHVAAIANEKSAEKREDLANANDHARDPAGFERVGVGCMILMRFYFLGL